MSRQKLTLACGLYDRTDALRTGDVKVEGIDIDFIAISNPREIFDRMGGKQEFDVSEFSSSEFISRLGHGDKSFVAIPVFPSRVFGTATSTSTARPASASRRTSPASAWACRSTP